MGLINRAQKFLSPSIRRMQDVFHHSKYGGRKTEIDTKVSIEAAETKDKKTTHGGTKTKEDNKHGRPWYVRIGLTKKSIRLLPLSKHPVKCFGTFSPVTPFRLNGKNIISRKKYLSRKAA